MVQLGADRGNWLAFYAGVEHATHVAEAIRARGFSAATIFGGTRSQSATGSPPPSSAAKSARWLGGGLTAGSKAPGVDLIAMLRPTKSAVLYVQKAGRGTASRLAGELPGARLRRQRRAARTNRRGETETPGSGEAEAPVKLCPNRQSIIATAVRLCPD